MSVQIGAADAGGGSRGIYAAVLRRLIGKA